MRLLVVEDSQRLLKYLTTGLRRAGYAIDTAQDGEEGLWLAESNEYDAIVLDIMLPKIDGLGVLTRLRANGSDTHILLLTAMDTVDDRVRGLDSGADDYLVKPFAFDELLARIQALVRRKYKTKSTHLKIGPLEIDTSHRKVLKGDEELSLKPREYALLEYLALRRGEVVARAEIEHHIYDDRAEPMSNVVNSAISILRKTIDSPGKESLIETRRGMGYVLDGGVP